MAIAEGFAPSAMATATEGYEAEGRRFSEQLLEIRNFFHGKKIIFRAFFILKIFELQFQPEILPSEDY